MARLESFATALLEAAPDAVIVSDADGRVVLLNLQAELLLGRTRDEVCGLDLSELVVPADEPPKLPLFVERRKAGHTVERVAVGRERRVPVEVTLAPVNVDGKPFTIAVLHDLTERRRLEEELRYLSMHDALTGLANRAGFEAALSLLEVRGPHPVGVVMVDLDDLKHVNDERGHAAGDDLLRRAAEVLRATFRTSDVVARIGGDEFAVLASGRDAAALDTLAGRLAESIEAHNRRFELPPLRVSVGTAVSTQGGSIVTALRDADARMYAMKRSHHGRCGLRAREPTAASLGDRRPTPAGSAARRARGGGEARAEEGAHGEARPAQRSPAHTVAAMEVTTAPVPPESTIRPGSVARVHELRDRQTDGEAEHPAAHAAHHPAPRICVTTSAVRRARATSSHVAKHARPVHVGHRHVEVRRAKVARPAVSGAHVTIGG